MHSSHHADPYAHGDEGCFGQFSDFPRVLSWPISVRSQTKAPQPRQTSCGVWYFHRKGGTYKSGSFKGMDLACGDKDKNVFAGLLLRAVLDPSDKLIEGPCLVVDKILEMNGTLEKMCLDAKSTFCCSG